MIAELKISNIDYKSIAELILRGSDKVGTGLRSFIQLLIKSTNMLPQTFINKVVVGLFNKNKEMLAGEINHFLEKYYIIATVDDLFMKQEMEQVNVQVSISRVDYEKIAIHFLPQLISIIPENEKTAVIPKALELLKEEREQIIHGVLSSIDEAKKEELLKLFVNFYSDKLCGLVNGLLIKNNIVASIEDIKIK